MTSEVLSRLHLTEAESRSTSDAQGQTGQTFGFKWAKRDTYDSEAMRGAARAWLIERYCSGDPGRVSTWLEGGRKTILDAGCGAGFSSLLLFGSLLRDHDYVGVDISDAVDVARQRFAEAGIPGQFARHDITDLPIPDDSVDLIFSEGVLHHTDSTEGALHALARKLKPGGRFLFYVYARKAVVREFTDDLIRERLRALSDEQAWEALLPLTKLGESLGRIGMEIEVPEDIPLLEIRAGRYDLQRFLYWHICKLFYRPDLTLEEMNHINFDWFRPLNCHRQTAEQVREWCESADLHIEHMDVQEAGITVVARRGQRSS